MNPRCLWIAGLLSVCLLACGQQRSDPPIVIVNEISMRIGDDPGWSRADLDDSDWETIEFDDVPQVDSVLWLRARIDLEPENLPRGGPLGIYLAALASHEIWWDGELIARGGVVGGSAEEEIPGPIQILHAVPDRLAAPGSHLIALRTSAFHRHFHPQTGYWFLVVGDYDRLTSLGASYTRVSLICLSGIVMMGIFAFMMFAQDPRDRSFLFLALLCLAGGTLLIAESWRNLFGYTYNWHLLRLVIVTGLSLILDLLLLIFLARRFPMKWARWFVVIGISGAAVALVAASWDPKVIFGFTWVFFLATLWCLRAILQRLPGSLLAATGVTFCLGTVLVEPSLFLDRNLYPALIFLLLCLLGSHVLQVRRVRKEREAALLKSARLELELIRKHIQPHFLLNTLNALSEWIDQEPRVAAGMIQSLAEEFRVLSDISNRSLIRMDEEIRLCRTHLEIMSRRKGREYRMATDGVDPQAPIPPAVIHTLVENAITHGRHTGVSVELRLSEERRGGLRRYMFSSPDSAPAGAQAPDGTGLRYIKARLQESFGEGWSLRSRSDGSSWITEILVPERM